ncbi:MAG TPA: hypothetical protein VGH51_17680 [Candidatus Angelobacter sp.]|jgi:ABC-type methionine transport system permease subunit
MAHLSSSNPWRGSRQRPGRSKGLPKISRRELHTMLVFIVFMLIAILLGMYLGWWLTMREKGEIEPPANTHSGASHAPERYLR